MIASRGTVIIGAGIGGLCAALRLAQAGQDVTVLDRHAAPGGKMRTLLSPAGPVDAGPTVLTMRSVFDDLFHAAGSRTEDHVTLRPVSVLARHFWSDGTTLDLDTDPDRSRTNIADTFGSRAAADFSRFSARAGRLFEAFHDPIMTSAAPNKTRLMALVLRNPRLLRDMMPHRNLAASLAREFREPRLAQLFGRYATYVGGSPYGSPALLALIWHVEASGIWRVEGGMHRLAQAIATLAEARGARFRYNADVTRIEWQDGRPAHVCTRDERLAAETVIFNGDPAALHRGALGPTARQAVAETAVLPRSHSADVLAFAAKMTGPALDHHNVFFSDDPAKEFSALSMGRRPAQPTLYVCAQDRGDGQPSRTLERFEIIANAPPLQHGQPDRPPTERATCQKTILDRLRRFELTFTPEPEETALTDPQGFDTLFPHSDGALYGRSPHGMTAAFARPTARTALPGLYLAGGGAHPGAGVPMAALSGRHAAEAILSDQISTSTSRRTAMPGGMSTGSLPTDAAPSRSSAS